MLNNKLLFFVLSIIIIIILLNLSMYNDLQQLNYTLHIQNKDSTKKHRIALIYKQNSKFTSQLTVGANEAASELSVSLQKFHTGPSEELQIKDYIDLAILAQYDGIIVDGENPSIVENIKKASKNNIPIVTIISDLPGSERISYVGVNNHRAGFIIGRTLLKKFQNKKANIAIISTKYNNENNSPSAEYLKIFGFKEAISSNNSAKIVTWKQIEPSILKETELVLDILETHPEVNSIFTTNISATTAASNIKNKFSKDFYLIGYGNNETFKEYLNKNILNANVYIDPVKIGKNSVKEITTYLENKKANLYSNIELELQN